jgi:hypothetical protein
MPRSPRTAPAPGGRRPVYALAVLVTAVLALLTGLVAGISPSAPSSAPPRTVATSSTTASITDPALTAADAHACVVARADRSGPGERPAQAGHLPPSARVEASGAPGATTSPFTTGPPVSARFTTDDCGRAPPAPRDS